MNIHEWAQRWNIPAQALDELLSVTVPETTRATGSEAAISQDIRLHASKTGRILWRNNSGAVTTEDRRHIRFGLGNDSEKINRHFKSSDLIGITPVTITPHHVGRMLGVFTAHESKAGNWKFRGTGRELAQQKYMQVVQRYGGFATFGKSIQEYELCIAHAHD
jgi:hypothetical protein